MPPKKRKVKAEPLVRAVEVKAEPLETPPTKKVASRGMKAVKEEPSGPPKKRRRPGKAAALDEAYAAETPPPKEVTIRGKLCSKLNTSVSLW